MKLTSYNTNRFEKNDVPKTTLSRKPHRTIAKGLTLLDGKCNKIEENKCNIDYSTSKHVNELPHDLFTYEILAKLPIKTLLQLKSVSKYWCSTVSSYDFANVHFKHGVSGSNLPSPVECLFVQVGSKFYLFYVQEGNVVLNYSLVKLEPNFDKIVENDMDQLVGSCNGLVCLANSSISTGYFHIWNPITYESRKIIDPCHVTCYSDVSWGFSYVSSIDDYKVVKIVQDYDTLVTDIHVFSTRSQEWTRVNDHGLSHGLALTSTNPGVLVNESIYWIMVSRRPIEKRVVVRFNLITQKFEEVSGLIPREISPKDQFLCVIEGCLAVYTLNVLHEAYISILKKSEEAEKIQVSSYSDKRVFSGLVGSTMTRKCFVLSNGMKLALMDTNTPQKQDIPFVSFEQANRACIVSYVPSLISPFSISL